MNHLLVFFVVTANKKPANWISKLNWIRLNQKWYGIWIMERCWQNYLKLPELSSLGFAFGANKFFGNFLALVSSGHWNSADTAMRKRDKKRHFTKNCFKVCQGWDNTKFQQIYKRCQYLFLMFILLRLRIIKITLINDKWL